VQAHDLSAQQEDQDTEQSCGEVKFSHGFQESRDSSRGAASCPPSDNAHGFPANARSYDGGCMRHASCVRLFFMTTPHVAPLELIPELDALARSAGSIDALMSAIVSLLYDKLGCYNWVGFYTLEKEAGGDVLVLGPFKGAPTPHSRIPLNQGICGAAVSARKTLVVDDVSSDPRYLACSLETKSEIVVPIFLNGEVAGELDIDSHSAAAFGAEDRELCEHAATIVGRYLESRAR